MWRGLDLNYEFKYGVGGGWVGSVGIDSSTGGPRLYSMYVTFDQERKKNQPALPPHDPILSCLLHPPLRPSSHPSHVFYDTLSSVA